MIHVVVMKCLTGLPLLIYIQILWRSRGQSFKNWGVGVGSFVYRLHSPDYKDVISRKTSCAELIACTLNVRNICRILVANIWREDPGVGLKMILKWILQTCCECLDWLHLAHDRVQCRAVLKRAVNREDDRLSIHVREKLKCHVYVTPRLR
jgi:hypothetical protein